MEYRHQQHHELYNYCNTVPIFFSGNVITLISFIVHFSFTGYFLYLDLGNEIWLVCPLAMY